MTPTPRSTPRPILDVAADVGLGADLVAPHGRHRAKVSLDALPPPDATAAAAKRARYVLVTAVTPTGAGEGKTVSAIGLAMGLCRRGHRAVVTLRQSSLGPTFGAKGGGAGGGAARLEPLDECLLGLGADLFAVESANNLLAAVVDDAVHRGRPGAPEPSSVTWRRVVNVDDRALRRVVAGLGGRANGPLRETGFDITAASEVMAVLSMAHDLADLRRRLGEIVVGFDTAGKPVRAEDVRAAGAMAALLRRAAEPNLLQTCEGTPALVHGGPFANIAQGNSTVIADRVVLPRADYVVTEAGFAADLGAEKFLDLKCRASGFSPDAVVLVATVRAVKSHATGAAAERGGVAAVADGAANLRRHVANLRLFGVPVVVTVNRFPDDTAEELAALRDAATAEGALSCVEHDAFARGGAGAVDLADAVADACAQPSAYAPLYALQDSIAAKVETLATRLYGAADVAWDPAAATAVARFEEAGYGTLPVCVAKTHLSLSHDPALRGAPTGYTLPVRDARLYAGAGFVTVLTGDIVTMPGLPRQSHFSGIDLDADGDVVGLV